MATKEKQRKSSREKKIFRNSSAEGAEKKPQRRIAQDKSFFRDFCRRSKRLEIEWLQQPIPEQISILFLL
jgi:hypothetical protein